MALWRHPGLEALLGGPLEQGAITEANLRNLVTEVPAEADFVDYKSGMALTKPPTRDPKWNNVQERARDVCAPANAHGAILVYGIEDHREHTVVDDRMQPIQETDAKDRHAFIDEIRRGVRQYAAPVPTVDVIHVQAEGDPHKFYLVVVIPPSPLAPHAVVAQSGEERKPVHYFVRQPGETNIRYLTEYEIAEKYATRARGFEDRQQRLDQLWIDGVDELTPSGAVWIAMAAYPDLPAADGRLTRQARKEIQEWEEREPFPVSILGKTGARVGRPFPSPGRLVFTELVATADGGTPVPGAVGSYRELHVDGSIFAALSLFEGQGATVAIGIDGLVDDIHALTTHVLNYLIERTGLWGNATIVVGVVAAGAAGSATLTLDSSGGTSTHGLRRLDRRLPKTTVVVDLAGINSAQDRLAAAYDAALPIVQAFGVPEPNWITEDGAINTFNLLQDYRRHVREWAVRNNVDSASLP